MNILLKYLKEFIYYTYKINKKTNEKDIFRMYRIKFFGYCL